MEAVIETDRTQECSKFKGTPMSALIRGVLDAKDHQKQNTVKVAQARSGHLLSSSGTTWQAGHLAILGCWVRALTPRTDRLILCCMPLPACGIPGTKAVISCSFPSSSSAAAASALLYFIKIFAPNQLSSAEGCRWVSVGLRSCWRPLQDPGFSPERPEALTSTADVDFDSARVPPRASMVT